MIVKAIKTAIEDIRLDIKGCAFWENPAKHIFYRFGWHLRPIFHWIGKKPLAVDVELSNGCNFRCTMCQQSTNWLKKEDEKFMSWETLKIVGEECVRLGVPSMKVNWRGEPTLDHEVAEKIAYLKRRGIHEVQMNTNASKLTPELCDKLIDSGLDRIIFSCDGLSKETYNTIRRGGNFDAFFKNVILFRQRRNAKDAARKWPHRGIPIIRINMAVMEQNKHEKGSFKDFFKDIADEFTFNSVYQPQSSNLNNGQKRIQKRKGCPQIWQRMVVSVDGSTVPCCVDFREKAKLGNVSEINLEKMWFEQVKPIRLAHLKHEGRKIDACANCDNFALSEIDKEKNEVVWR